MYILGVRVDNLTKSEIHYKIDEFLAEKKFHQIATINPEFILTAQKNLEFKKIINNSDLCVADGVGVWYAFIRNFSYLKKRYPGVDLMHEILYRAYKHNLKVYLVVNKKGLSSFKEIKETLENSYPTLQVGGRSIDPKNEAEYKQLNTSYDILLCNLGAPCQEKFINCQKDGKIRLAMGVGSSLDYLSGKIKRAPLFLQVLGLEWLWRIFLQIGYDRRYFKKRLIRILKAILVFPIRVTINK